jgi:hypothetical protein
MDGPINLRWENSGIDPDPSIKLVMDASVTITKAIIEVKCESNLFGTVNYDSHVHFRAMDAAKAVVATYAYARGLGLSAIIESVIKPDGVKYKFEEKRPELGDLVTAFGSISNEGHGRIDLAGMLSIIFSDPLIGVVFTDLVSSLTAPQHAPINCARAVEAIRTLMTPANADRKQGWPVMRENLNLDQAYLSFVTDQSRGPRHGDMKSVDFADVRETEKRAWIVMNRFLEFKKRGERKLPLVDFPLLQ